MARYYSSSNSNTGSSTSTGQGTSGDENKNKIQTQVESVSVSSVSVVRSYSGNTAVNTKNTKPKKSKNHKPKKQREKLRVRDKVLMGVLVLVSAVFACLAVIYLKRDAEIQSKWDDLKVVSDSGYDKTNKQLSYKNLDDPMDRVIDWDALKAINSDIVAWIYIPDTQIDYPILQEPELVTDGNYYYLHKDMYKSYDYMGCILMPKEPDGCDTLEMHQQIFGHHMIGKQMFGTLDKYKSYDFYAEQPYIYIYYPDRTERWQVWAAMKTTVSDMIYKMPYEYDTDEYKELIDHIEANKLYETSAGTVTNTMKTMTLSTCTGRVGGDNRFTVTNVLNKTKWIDEKSQEKSEKLDYEREQERIKQNQEDYENGVYCDSFEKNY